VERTWENKTIKKLAERIGCRVLRDIKRGVYSREGKMAMGQIEKATKGREKERGMRIFPGEWEGTLGRITQKIIRGKVSLKFPFGFTDKGGVLGRSWLERRFNTLKGE